MRRPPEVQTAQITPSLTLGHFVEQALSQAEPLSQNTSAGNLGFGWIYYSLVRNIRPAFVVAIGSRRGFMPFCAARAVQDNGAGKVIFIDPSYSGYGDPAWSGAGLWSDPLEVRACIESYGLSGWIHHLRMTSEQAFPLVREIIAAAQPLVVIIDGAHTHKNSLQDFELYSSLASEGVVVFHDAVSSDTGVPETIHELRTRGLPVVTLYRDVGLSMVELAPRFRVDERWNYLCRPSNRWDKIGEIAGNILRPGDRVLDGYCGWSPLAASLLEKEIKLFGFDSDPEIVARLQEQYPRHTWKVIDEYRLPFADLPDEIDVLAGLGVSCGYSQWDPKQVVNNVRYLLGRYFPRACLFETAAGYHDAAILQDLDVSLRKLGYVCRCEEFDTDLVSYSRRKLMLATREGPNQ